MCVGWIVYNFGEYILPFLALKNNIEAIFGGVLNCGHFREHQNLGYADIQSLLINLKNGYKYSHMCVGWIVYTCVEYILPFLVWNINIEAIFGGALNCGHFRENQNLGYANIQSLFINLTNGYKYSHMCVGWIVYTPVEYIVIFLVWKHNIEATFGGPLNCGQHAKFNM